MPDLKWRWERHVGDNRWLAVGPLFHTADEANHWRDTHPQYRTDNALMLVALAVAAGPRKETG